MSNEADDIRGQRPRFNITSYSSVSDLTATLAETIARELGCDLVTVQIRRDEELFVGRHPRAAGMSDTPLAELRDGGVFLLGHNWTLPLVVHDLHRARVPSELALELSVRKVRSCGIFSLYANGQLVGVAECFFTRQYHRWRQEEIQAFDELSTVLSAPESPGKVGSGARAPTSEDLKSQYRRLTRVGNLVIIITDSQFAITDVIGNTEQLLGVSASEMLSQPGIWDIILDPRDRTLLRRRIMRLKMERDELREEVRLIHQRSGEVRWMMLRALPQFNPSGAFLGWEGFGIDVTDRRRAQEALISQNRRLEALFEVARSLQGHTDPAMVTLRGLRALIRATGSHCGYGCFYHRDRDELELVAAHGLSERYIEEMAPVLEGKSLLRYAIDHQNGILIDNLQEDVRAFQPLAKIEDVKSTIVMPLNADGVVYGAIVLFRREARGYTEADFDLVSAAAVQITLAVRQAEMFESERRHAHSLGALYRISHELSKYRTPREIAEHAFPVMQQEFALKRLWFGVLNEQGTHLVGKAGSGPGVRRQLAEIQIELNLRHDFLDQAIRTQRAVVVDAGSPMECSGLNRLIQRLDLGTFVVIPLVSLGQIVGALIAEPMVPAAFLKDGRLQLLISMATEMATVLMSRRFESKMAEALKMRMAGLLASGVAHNFNNLLQAVLGQVSLIEMQVPKGSLALEATKTITEAAKRGASLVSQLLNFSTPNHVVKQTLSMNRLLAESQELYISLLGRKIEISIDAGNECPEVVADLSQVQQVITNLLANAKDAIGQKDEGRVVLSTSKVRLRSGEVDPELAPGVYIRLDIKDNGVGMNTEEQARCFEPFFTTKNVDRDTGVGLAGSGLGLSAAYSIVKQHDGLITVHSAPGEGSTFSVYLPVLSVRSGTGPEVVTRPRKSARGGVLLLGIDVGVEPFVKSFLESLGYRCRKVFDTMQALEIIRHEPDLWGFVIVDADALGTEEAPGSCKKLLESFPELCVMVATVSPKESAERLPTSSRLEVLEKPLGVWSLDSALARLTVRPTLDGLESRVEVVTDHSIHGTSLNGGAKTKKPSSPGISEGPPRTETPPVSEATPEEVH